MQPKPAPKKRTRLKTAAKAAAVTAGAAAAFTLATAGGVKAVNFFRADKHWRDKQNQFTIDARAGKLQKIDREINYAKEKGLVGGWSSWISKEREVAKNKFIAIQIDKVRVWVKKGDRGKAMAEGRLLAQEMSQEKGTLWEAKLKAKLGGLMSTEQFRQFIREIKK